MIELIQYDPGITLREIIPHLSVQVAESTSAGLFFMDSRYRLRLKAAIPLRGNDARVGSMGVTGLEPVTSAV